MSRQMIQRRAEAECLKSLLVGVSVVLSGLISPLLYPLESCLLYTDKKGTDDEWVSIEMKEHQVVLILPKRKTTITRGTITREETVLYRYILSVLMRDSS